MKISVVLCTYNRSQSLAKALDSIAASAVPAQVDWEVLVVDNNSPDQTRDVIENFCRRYPGRFRYIFEPRQGKSYALNTAISEAHGDVLAFVDDDVTVEPTWLWNLTAGLCRGEWVGAGGRILPAWNCPPPSWFPRKGWFGMAPLVMFDMGPKPTPLTDPPFGTNMAFHRTMFDKYGLFRTDLGPRPDSEIRNEDTEFGSRLLAAGELIRYEPSALVHHAVPEKRLTRQYFLKWWFDRGRGDVRGAGVAKEEKWLVAGIPLSLFRRIFMGTIRWMITLDPSQRFTYKLAVWMLAGTAVESRSHAAKQRFEDTAIVSKARDGARLN